MEIKKFPHAYIRMRMMLLMMIYIHRHCDGYMILLLRSCLFCLVHVRFAHLKPLTSIIIPFYFCVFDFFFREILLLFLHLFLFKVHSCKFISSSFFQRKRIYDFSLVSNFIRANIKQCKSYFLTSKQKK